ncbi:efflux transporter outer membrane subunit [Iodobacter fluviatilis]|uniref:Cation efflux system protein CusC n=1 Tax=Iodobacter fluviatilis TaxID=537 RepID=A0A377SXV1_9NEIS|nr:efflux transporter outer membrane subunit [Iodobacter fluviatilis]TCU82241.1 NodT family efflux transporter outer membrane factor (OMF) lipoprotein [Iodobacter fluviatilis]STR45136.1 Cation efflux system protein CusC precursor [Iodobacter fluviatilis]
MKKIILLSTVLLSACGSLLSPSPSAPLPAMPAHWAEQNQSASLSQGAWWLAFHDAELTKLIDDALQSNADLSVAAIRLRRAHLREGVSEHAAAPVLSGSGSGSVNRSFDPVVNRQSYNLTATASYEFDLWGRLASDRAAAREERIATEADRQALKLSISTSVASQYWAIALLDKKLAASTLNVQQLRQALAIAQAKNQAGALAKSEALSAEQSLLSEEANHTQLLQQRKAAFYNLSLLFDRPPQSFTLAGASLPQGDLPSISAGVPSEVLGRRPDLQAMEARLRVSLAQIDVARAAFYPSFSLTTSLGGSSSALAELFQNPVASAGLNLALPFLDWEKHQLNLDISRSQYEEQLTTFRQGLYKALAETEQALDARVRLAEQNQQLAQSLQLATKLDGIAQARFEAGATDIQPWLDAAARRRSAQTSLLQNRFDQASNLLAIYKALGGAVE